MHYNTSKINDAIATIVSEATKEMLEMAKEHNVLKIYFSQHENVYTPSAVFEDRDSGEFSVEDISEISFGRDEIIVISETGKFGYLDTCYGDYIDVPHCIGKIYSAFTDILNKNEICKNELI